MSTSGSITGSAKSNGSITSYYSFWVDWKRNGYSIENNTSNITVSLKVKCTASADSAWNHEMKPSVSLSVNGASKSPTIDYIDTRNNVTCTFATWTGDVTHKDDGSLSCPISASFIHYGSSSLDGGTVSGKASLDTIPRASTLTSAANVTLGNKCSVKWTPKAASFRYKLKFVLGSWSYTTGAIHPNTTSAYTYTGYAIPLDVAKQITGDKTGTMTVYLYTYSNSGATTQVGSADSSTFTVTVPDNSNTKPSVTMTLVPVSSLGSAFSGLYVQGKSKVKATLSAEGEYSATIKSYSIKVEGTSYGSSAGYTSGYLPNYGSVTVYGYATDSRGYTGNTSKKITVLAYSKPKITVSVCGRCDADGNLSDSGTYLKIKATRSYSTVTSGGVQKNFCQIRYRYKAASASSYSAWQPILAMDDLGSNTISTKPLLDGTLAKDTSYLVQVGVIDNIGESAATTISITTEAVHTHRAKNSIGFGKYSECENCLDMGWDIELNGNELLRNGVPAFAPPGWGYGGAMDYIVDESGTFETKLNEIMAGMVNHSVKQFSFYDTKGLISKKFFGTLWRYTGDYAALEAINYDGNKAIKCMYGGKWKPWEWVNPPMAPGVEYRTTERNESGMPVYCKLISYTNSATIGSDSSVVETQIPHNISSFDALVRITGRQGGVYPVPGITSSGNPYAVSRVSSTYIYLRTVKNSFDSRTWFFTVYYTKK